MPYRKDRSRKKQLPAAALVYLSDADTTIDGVDDFHLWCLRAGMPGFDGTSHPRELWGEHRDEFLPDFIAKNPCRRPLPWWQWDAPRHDTGTGAYYEPLPIPRRRMGGKGQTMVERYPAVVPTFTKGIPSSWAHIDPDNPPCFESEAHFLERHGLLTAAEKAHLRKHPELLEPEKIKLMEDRG